jgi:hypothetical protein
MGLIPVGLSVADSELVGTGTETDMDAEAGGPSWCPDGGGAA